MLGSVRLRLTVAVAVVVGAIALAAALIAPRVVRSSLIDDRLDAQEDVETAELTSGLVYYDVSRLNTAELTAVFGPDIVELTHGLDSVGALDQLRSVDSSGHLYVLAGPDLVATVTDDGRVRVQSDPGREVDTPVVSKQRLERLAADYGVDRRFDTFPDLIEDSSTFEQFLDEFATQFAIDIGDYLDPGTFEGFPEFRIEGQLFPRDLFEMLQDEIEPVEPAGGPAAVETNEIVVGTRSIAGRPVLLTASTDGIANTVSRLRTLLWLGVPIAAAAAALLTWVLAGRSLRPVAAITERTRQIRSSTLHERVPVPTSHDEIAALATEMNTMLDRVQREDERRRQFVSDASHELRSPIATIRAQAEAAVTDDAQAELAGGVLAEAERMSVLVDDLLSLARHDEQLAAPGQMVDLDDLIYADAARPRRVPVDVSAVSAGQVRARPDELARVVTHLIDNAARHATDRVAVGLSTDPDGQVVLTVDDDGEGIAPEDRERVFERFVRLDEARTRDSGGAGLGLAVVDTVVRSLGGTIEAESAPLGGARLRAEFPPVS